MTQGWDLEKADCGVGVPGMGSHTSDKDGKHQLHSHSPLVLRGASTLPSPGSSYSSESAPLFNKGCQHPQTVQVRTWGLDPPLPLPTHSHRFYI